MLSNTIYESRWLNGHRIKNLDEMYNASYTLQKQLVEGNNEYSIDTILQNLKDNIDTLKESWYGTTQIITNGNGNVNSAHILSVTINKLNQNGQV